MYIVGIMAATCLCHDDPNTIQLSGNFIFLDICLFVIRSLLPDCDDVIYITKSVKHLPYTGRPYTKCTIAYNDELD